MIRITAKSRISQNWFRMIKKNGYVTMSVLLTNLYTKGVRYDEGAVLYSKGINSFRQLAKDAKAIYRVNRIVLVNTEKVDEYLELMCADDPSDF